MTQVTESSVQGFNIRKDMGDIQRDLKLRPDTAYDDEESKGPYEVPQSGFYDDNDSPHHSYRTSLSEKIKQEQVFMASNKFFPVSINYVAEMEERTELRRSSSGGTEQGYE